MTRAAVPAPVTRVLDEASTWLPASMAAVERRLAELVEGYGGELSEAAASTLASGGKRLRPLLVLVCSPPGGGRPIRGAVAVELIHMATLVHDDVLDAAPLRRGRPTVFATAGRRHATATGDLLFSRALAELASGGDGDQLGKLTAASVSLARGELAQRRDAYDVSISRERYLQRCSLKTAALFECACTIGSRDGDLGGFGRQIGVAFQMLDDVLDVVGPPERTGKARGTDLLDGTVTLPLILARRRDPALAALDLRSLEAEEAEAACDRIVATGATQAVRRDARDRVAAAKRGLGRLDLDDERRRLLELVADGVVERYS